MKITQTNKKGLVQTFKAVVPVEEFQAAYTNKLMETSKKVKLAGFRPGNVPVHVVEQKYGQAIKGETAEDLIQNGVATIRIINYLSDLYFDGESAPEERLLMAVFGEKFN